MAAEFTHLHLHTDYSLLDGACDVDKLVDHLEQDRPDLRRHDRPRQHLRRSPLLRRHEEEATSSPSSAANSTSARTRTTARSPTPSDKYNHLLVLAENEAGYRNLVRLTSEAALHGFYRKPRVSKKFLAEHSEGLIGFSGCLAGEVCAAPHGREVRSRPRPAAGVLRRPLRARATTSSKFRTTASSPTKVTEATLPSRKATSNIPLIATNDSHYVADEDSRAHEVLLCVQTADIMNNPKRFKFDTQEFYIKTAEEMRRLFPDRRKSAPAPCSSPSAATSSCTQGRQSIPEVRCARRRDHRQLLRSRSAAKAGRSASTPPSRHLEIARHAAQVHRRIRSAPRTRNRHHQTDEVPRLLPHRLGLHPATPSEHDIPVGPGRGSAAGSLVAYVHGDHRHRSAAERAALRALPQSRARLDARYRHRLLHEPPRRGHRLRHAQKYGRDQVAQIITFNTMAAKAAIKDVGRALDMPYGEVDRIAKMIPPPIGITIDQALERFADARAGLRQRSARSRNSSTPPQRLEGLVRGAGVHAAGVVIAPRAAHRTRSRHARPRTTTSSPPTT